ncbi:MAG: regulatory iron-sulfur-containing complex subunit RicT [Candidatus Hatepunaea meridiana]|nr:regulatory iron-sulfur-containing complex subunit RicT [Candidatus Hatepunaea meridiana]
MISECNMDSSVKRGSFLLVEFKGNRLDYFGNPWEFPFKRGDLAVVETERGQDAGYIRCVFTKLIKNRPPPEFDVVRRATVQDVQRMDRLREYEKQALTLCNERIKAHILKMKLVEAECRFDGLKLTFFFTSEGRVDFRELVKDLAGAFRTRIDLRQIGARDETKRSDCYGTCGRKLCCISFLESFQPITTQMARVQNLILNPSKLSGRCNRLKCCLAYEYDDYCKAPTGQSVMEVTEPDEDSEGVEQISD